MALSFLPGAAGGVDAEERVDRVRSTSESVEDT